MSLHPLPGCLVGCFCLALLSACAADPYVYKADEFNRGSASFKKDPADRSDVAICYNSRSATPSQVRTLAEQECARFGKKARVREQGFGDCPLSTPTMATFQCTGGRLYGHVTGGDGHAVSSSGGGSPYTTIDWRLPEWFYGPRAVKR